MAWDNLASNQPVNGINLRDAVSKGLFAVKSGQTIPNNDKCFTKNQVYALIDIQQLSGNKLVKKSEIISATIQWAATYFGDLNTVCGLPVDRVLYSNSIILDDSTFFYLDAARTNPVFAEVFVIQDADVKVKIQTYTNGRLRTKEPCSPGFPFMFSYPQASDSGICSRPIDTTYYFATNQVGNLSVDGRVYLDAELSLPAEIGWVRIGPGQITGPYKWAKINRGFDGPRIYSFMGINLDTNCPP